MYDEQKSREPEIAPELIALERQLRGMTPAVPRIDRDQMMFAAGQAAAPVHAGQDGRAMYDRAGNPHHIAGPFRAGGRFWPAATFTMTAATLLLATMLVWQRQTLGVASQSALPLPAALQVSDQAHEAIAQSPVQFAISKRDVRAFQHPTSGYLGIRYVALTRGVDALEPSISVSADDADSSKDTPQTQRNILKQLVPSARNQMNPRS
jgi:hypothetical protein